MTDIKVEKIDIVYSFSVKETSFSGKKGIRWERIFPVNLLPGVLVRSVNMQEKFKFC